MFRLRVISDGQLATLGGKQKNIPFSEVFDERLHTLWVNEMSATKRSEEIEAFYQLVLLYIHALQQEMFEVLKSNISMPFIIMESPFEI